MLTISRALAKRLGDVLRRVSPRRGRSTPHFLRLWTDNQGLRLRFATDDIIVAFALDGSFGFGDLQIPLDVLGAVQGSGQEPVAISPTEPTKVVVRWNDAGVPQSLSVDVPAAAPESAPSVEPTEWEENPADLIACLLEAGKVAPKDSVKYALQRLCLRGKGDVIATDGRQLLRCGGFCFPWTEELLVPVLPVLGAAELQAMTSWMIGKTDDFVVLRAGPWEISLRIDKTGRFPKVDQVIPMATGNGSTWRIAPEDAQFLLRTLPRLPGKDDYAHPVTVDLNGQICVRAKGEDQPQITEVVLTRSDYSGKPVKIACDRQFLLRAVQLGMTEARIENPDHPIVFEIPNRLYLFVPLSSKTALVPREGATRLESAASTQTSQPKRTRPMEPKIEPVAEVAVTKPRVKSSPRGDGAAGLLTEAQALRDHLREGCRRANDLMRSLKRHRRQSKLVMSTLASLRQLQTIGR